MKTRTLKPTLLDSLLLSLTFLLILALNIKTFSTYITAKKQGALYLYIKTPYHSYKYPLETNRIIKVNGLLGEYWIEIKNRKVRVIKSNCPRKLCMKKIIQNPGEEIICVPNNIIVRIENNGEEIDAVSE